MSTYGKRFLWILALLSNISFASYYSVSGGGGGSGTSWSLLGNSGTTAGTNFLGTTDGVDLVFKTGGTEYFRITSAGALDTTLGTGLLHSDSSGILTSSLLVNADVSGSAAIAYSKLNLTGSILNADVSSSAAIAYSKLNLALGIVNGDISASAAIARSKIATGTAYRILANDSGGAMSENAALTASRAVASDANGQLTSATTTTTQLNYLASATAALASTSTTGLLSSTDWNTFNGKGSGSVTSVALTMPGVFSVSGSPVTTSGTLAVTASGTSGGIPYFSGATTLASSAALAANQLVLGGGAATTPATLGSLGTTTTVLHGNAAGAPTFGAVSLTADVSGTLPIANGGTNNGSLSVSAGSVYYGDGTKLVALAPGTSGYLLQSNGTSAPSWVAVASATPTIFGSRGTPRSVVAATGITSGASHMSTTAAIQDIYVEGSAAGDNICATITAGTIDGQRMTIVGRNDSNILTLDSTTTNVVVNGSASLGANDTITLRWDTSSWVEQNRNF